MKKALNLSFALMILSIFMIGCKDNPNQKATEDSATTASTITPTQTPKVSQPLIRLTKNQEENNPQTTIVVNAKGLNHEFKVNSDCNLIEKKDFSTERIPEKALEACKCWWAGAGSDYYVIEESGKINIYQKHTGEGLAVDDAKWMLFKTLGVEEAKALAIPAGYKLVGEARGDLNKDDVQEKVLVFDTDQTNDFGTIRAVHVQIKKDGVWTLWYKTIGAVLPSEHGGMMGDPFESVSIKNTCIVFQHFGGSRGKWHYTHRFRHQNDQWELIGATIEEFTFCEYAETMDYNLSTGKIHLKKETKTCEGDKEVDGEVKEDKWTKKLAKLPNMDGFYPGSNKLDLKESEKSLFY